MSVAGGPGVWPLVVGVGCRRGASVADLDELLTGTLAERGLKRADIVVLSTLDTKAEEPGVVGLAVRLGVPLTTHPADRLAAEVAPTPSGAVAAHVGTPSVAEAAVLACGARLLVPKRKAVGVTLAIGVLPPGPDQPSRAARHTG